MENFVDHEVVLQGFTANISSTEDPDLFSVELFEGGNQVYDTEIPVDMEAQDGDEIFVEDIINYAAQAAIDLFESERGTLGQGAGATMATKKKAALWEINDLEKWFLKFKGTGFEEEAANLVEQKLGIQLERFLVKDPSPGLYAEQGQIEYDMAMLNLERIREGKNQTVIIVQSHSLIEGGSEESDLIESYLNKFIGDKREDKALRLVQDYLDVAKKLNTADTSLSDLWKREDEIDNLMQDLSLQLLQQNVIEVQPTEGAEALPNMAADIAELMEGVSLDVPFEEIAARVAQAEANEIEELGKKREGLDPAEVPERMLWGMGQHVKLKKDVIQNLMGGMQRIIPKGTKVVVDSLYDGHGDYYLVTAEDTGKLFRAKWSDLE